MGDALRDSGANSLNKKLNQLKEHGIKLFKANNYTNALKCFDKVLQYRSDDTEALTNKGQTLYHSQKYKEAIACFDAVLKLVPNDTDALNNKGNTLCQLGEYGSALKCYEQVLIVEPNHSQALKNRNIGLRAQGKELVTALQECEEELQETNDKADKLDKEIAVLKQRYQQLKRSASQNNNNSATNNSQRATSNPNTVEDREREQIQKNLNSFRNRLDDLDKTKRELEAKERELQEKQEALLQQESEIIDKKTKHKLRRQQTLKELMDARLEVQKEKAALEKERSRVQQRIEVERKKLSDRLESLATKEQRLEGERKKLQNEREVLEKLIEQRQRESVNESMEKLNQAIKKKNLAKIRKLLQGGADRTERDDLGATPLHHAAKTGKLSIVEILLDPSYGGIDPPFVGIKDKEGKTAIDWANDSGAPKRVRELLQRKEQEEKVEAESREQFLVEDLYKSELRYQQIYSACMAPTTAWSMIEKKNIAEIYYRYKHFYHPFLKTTKLFKSVTFDITAYTNDGTEPKRLRSEESRYANKATKLHKVEVPKFERDHVFPFKNLHDYILGIVNLSTNEVNTLLQKISSTDMLNIFDKNSLSYESLNELIKNWGDSKKTCKEVKKLDELYKENNMKLQSLLYVAEFYVLTSRRAKIMLNILDYTPQALERFVGFAADIEARVQSKNKIYDTALQCLTGASAKKVHDCVLHMNVLPLLTEIIKALEAVKEEKSGSLFDNTSSVKKLTKSVHGALKNLVETHCGKIRLTPVAESDTLDFKRRVKAIDMYKKVLEEQISRWKP